MGGFKQQIPVVIRPNPPLGGPLPFQRPRAGGFVSFAIPKAGIYRLATREAWEAMEVLNADQALAKIELSATASVFCSIGRIQDYSLAAGNYVVQFVSTYTDHAYLEVVERKE